MDNRVVGKAGLVTLPLIGSLMRPVSSDQPRSRAILSLMHLAAFEQFQYFKIMPLFLTQLSTHAVFHNQRECIKYRIQK